MPPARRSLLEKLVALLAGAKPGVAMPAVAAQLDPCIALTIAMESAVPMSKIDLAGS